ncbi:hypothetical protein [Halobellus marinus]|uniref:hypothetical protein n=1 Tax=Halobellus TaxID=1073986 RepID=UPI0028AF2F8D|nr:hypothetical protein [Halobellus sp. DFY28]
MTDDQDEIEELRQGTEMGDRLASAGSEGRPAENEQEGEDTTPTGETATTNDSTSGEGSITAEDLSSEQTETEQQERESNSEAVEEDLVVAIDNAFDNLEENDRALHIWNEDLAAVFAVLKERPGRKEQLAEKLDEQSQGNVEVGSQSELLGYILWVGLKEIEPGLVEALREAKTRRVRREL